MPPCGGAGGHRACHPVKSPCVCAAPMKVIEDESRFDRSWMAPCAMGLEATKLPGCNNQNSAGSGGHCARRKTWLSMVTVAAALLCCVLLTLPIILVMGIGIGFHYCSTPPPPAAQFPMPMPMAMPMGVPMMQRLGGMGGMGGMGAMGAMGGVGGMAPMGPMGPGPMPMPYPGPMGQHMP